jgi:DNA-binding NarL/FixJ family response regulator
MSLRILVVDDHPVVRRGVQSLLESHEGWEVCGESTNGRDAVEQSRQIRPVCLGRRSARDSAASD